MQQNESDDELPPEAFLSAEGSQSYSRAWILIQPAVMRFIDTLTTDYDHREDLRQEAIIAIWNADPTRYDLKNPEDLNFLRRVVRNRLIDVWGRNRGKPNDDTGTPHFGPPCDPESS